MNFAWSSTISARLWPPAMFSYFHSNSIFPASPSFGTFPKKLYFPCIIIQSNLVFHPLLGSGASRTFILPNTLATQVSVPDPTWSTEKNGQMLCNFGLFPLSFPPVSEGKEEKSRDVLPTCWYEFALLPHHTPLRSQKWPYSSLVFWGFFVLFCFLGPHPQHIEVPRLGVEAELYMLAYTTAIAMLDPSHICKLHHSSWQCQILNPPSQARDWTCILMDVNQIHFCWATTGTPSSLILNYYFSLIFKFLFQIFIQVLYKNGDTPYIYICH